MTTPPQAQPEQQPEEQPAPRADVLPLIAGVSVISVMAALAVMRTDDDLHSQLVNVIPWLKAVKPADAKAVTAVVSHWPQEPVQGIGTATRQARETNEARRAAFLVNSLKRLRDAQQAAASRGEDAADVADDTLEAERRNFALHMKAVNFRATAAGRVDAAAGIYGELLGWYSDIDRKCTPECRAANGKNFYAHTPPVIGWPGMAHVNCRCAPGKPHANAPVLPTPGLVLSNTYDLASKDDHHIAGTPYTYRHGWLPLNGNMLGNNVYEHLKSVAVTNDAAGDGHMSVSDAGDFVDHLDKAEKLEKSGKLLQAGVHMKQAKQILQKSGMPKSTIASYHAHQTALYHDHLAKKNEDKGKIPETPLSKKLTANITSAAGDTAQAGDTIHWSLNGKDYTGTVTKNDASKSYLHVKPDDGDEQSLSKHHITKVDSPAKAPTPVKTDAEKLAETKAILQADYEKGLVKAEDFKTAFGDYPDKSPEKAAADAEKAKKVDNTKFAAGAITADEYKAKHGEFPPGHDPVHAAYSELHHAVGKSTASDEKKSEAHNLLNNAEAQEKAGNVKKAASHVYYAKKAVGGTPDKVNGASPAYIALHTKQKDLTAGKSSASVAPSVTPGKVSPGDEDLKPGDPIAYKLLGTTYQGTFKAFNTDGSVKISDSGGEFDFPAANITKNGKPVKSNSPVADKSIGESTANTAAGEALTVGSKKEYAVGDKVDFMSLDGLTTGVVKSKKATAYGHTYKVKADSGGAAFSVSASDLTGAAKAKKDAFPDTKFSTDVADVEGKSYASLDDAIKYQYDKGNAGTSKKWVYKGADGLYHPTDVSPQTTASPANGKESYALDNYGVFKWTPGDTKSVKIADSPTTGDNGLSSTSKMSVADKGMYAATLADYKENAAPKLTGAENTALNSYQGSGYVEINNALRHQNTGNFDASQLQPALRAKIKAIDSAMKKWQVPQDVVVTRGLHNAHWAEGVNMEGKTVTEFGYSSTAFKNSNFGGSIIMKITVPKGTNAVHMNGKKTSSHPGENELLLPRSTRYVVTKDENSGHQRILHVTALPPENLVELARRDRKMANLRDSKFLSDGAFMKVEDATPEELAAAQR